LAFRFRSSSYWRSSGIDCAASRRDKKKLLRGVSSQYREKTMPKEKNLSELFHDTLEATLSEDKMTNDALTEFAKSGVNEHAQAAE
jgi:hypothetical protein